MSISQGQTNLFKIIQDLEDKVTRLEKLPIVENWREVGSDGNPVFENSWTNYDAVIYNSVAFYKDPFGIVRLKGVIGGGSLNVNMFLLPVGFRPIKRLLLGVIGDAGTLGRIAIYNTGEVQAFGGPTTWQSLDGISFRSV